MRTVRSLAGRVALAKGLLVVVASVAVGMAVQRDPELSEPLWLGTLAGLVLVGGVVALYELGARGIAWVLWKVLPAPPPAEEPVPIPVPSLEAQQAPAYALGAAQGLGLLGAYVGGSAVAWVAVGVWAGATAPSGSIQAVLPKLAPAGILGGSLLGAGAVLLLFRRYLRHADRASILRQVGWGLGTARQLMTACALGVAIALGYCAVNLSGIVHRPDPDSLGLLARTASQSGSARVAWAIAAVFLAPPIEEFVFRGGLLAGLERTWGPWAAAATVTLVFVLVHLSETFHYWPATLAITVSAVGAVAVRRASGCLGPAVSLHLGYNVVLVGIALAASGRVG